MQLEPQAKRIIDYNSIDTPATGSVFLVIQPEAESDRTRIITDENLKTFLGITDLSGDIADLAGAGRTTETVKDNADDILSLDGRVTSLEGSLNPYGAMVLYTGSTLPSGWIWARGETIGNTGSGATYAGAEYEDLFGLYNVNGLYGNDGTAVFGNGDTVLAPDLRNIVPYGANASTRDISGVTHPATPLGTTHNDRVGPHEHQILPHAAGSTAGTGNFLQGTTADANYGTLSTGGISSGRTGATTLAAGIGINYIIKY